MQVKASIAVHKGRRCKVAPVTLKIPGRVQRTRSIQINFISYYKPDTVAKQIPTRTIQTETLKPGTPAGSLRTTHKGHPKQLAYRTLFTPP
jgi:hypothetical protein